MLKEISNCGNWKVYGSLKPKVLIAGHSHTFALYLALMRDPDLQDFFGLVTHSDFTNTIPQNNDYWNFVAELAAFQETVISWNGNQHNIHFLVDGNFEFNSIGLVQNKKFPMVPMSRVRELFRPTFYELGLILSRFADRSKLTLIGTPAPKSKNFLDERLSQDRFFVHLAESMGIPKEKIRATNDSLRVFMWELTQILTEETAKEFGSKFLPTPASSYDQKKVLKANFYTDDLTHANEEFGKLVFSELVDLYGLKNEH